MDCCGSCLLSRRFGHHAGQQTLREQYVEDVHSGRELHLRHLLRHAGQLCSGSGQRPDLGRAARGRVHVAEQPHGDDLARGPAERGAEYHVLHDERRQLVETLYGDRSGQCRAQIRACGRHDRYETKLGDRTGVVRPCLSLFLGRTVVGRRSFEPESHRVGRTARSLSDSCTQSLGIRPDRDRHRPGCRNAGSLGTENTWRPRMPSTCSRPNTRYGCMRCRRAATTI